MSSFVLFGRNGRGELNTETCVLGRVQYPSSDEFIPYNIPAASRLLMIEIFRARHRNSETGNALPAQPHHVEHACVHYARTKIAQSDRSRISRLDIYQAPQVRPIGFNALQFECIFNESLEVSFAPSAPIAVDLTVFFLCHVKICFEIHLSSRIIHVPYYPLQFSEDGPA